MTLEPVFWEHEPLLATESFQAQITRPSETDIAVVILWSRLGTRLPAAFTRDDASRYASGTEYEFEDALTSWREHGRPDVLVYRKTAEPLVSLKDKEALLESVSQRARRVQCGRTARGDGFEGQNGADLSAPVTFGSSPHRPRPTSRPPPAHPRGTKTFLPGVSGSCA